MRDTRVDMETTLNTMEIDDVECFRGGKEREHSRPFEIPRGEEEDSSEEAA